MTFPTPTARATVTLHVSMCNLQISLQLVDSVCKFWFRNYTYVIII
jgi:hypothetical protein